jgi:hypothetical protein
VVNGNWDDVATVGADDVDADDEDDDGEEPAVEKETVGDARAAGAKEEGVVGGTVVESGESSTSAPASALPCAPGEA